jgi:hypothetical protein
MKTKAGAQMGSRLFLALSDALQLLLDHVPIIPRETPITDRERLLGAFAGDEEDVAGPKQ